MWLDAVVCTFILLFLFSKQSNAFQVNQAQPPTPSDPIVMGYYSEWAIYSPNIHIQDLPSQLMTHLVYKSANLTKSGDIEVSDIFADIEHLYPTVNIEEEEFLGNFGQLIKLKNKHPNLKNIISIGGWGRSENFSVIASTKTGREKIAKSAVEFMVKYKFDGIEIDWQFPIGFSPSPYKGQVLNQIDDAKNLSLLMVELNKQCKKVQVKCWLQVVLAPYSLDDYWQASLLSANVNTVVIDVSRVHGDRVERTEHLSPLFSAENERSIDQLIGRLIEFGIEKHKIIPAIPSFAVGWDGVPNESNGLKQLPKRLSWGSWDGNSSGATGIYNQKSLSYFLESNQYKRYWDELSQASYLYTDKRFNGHFISFENERSIQAKVNYVENENLAGLAVRQLHNGDNVLKTAFYKFYVLKGIYFKLQEFWFENRSVLTLMLQLFAIFLIVIIGLAVYFNKLRQTKFFERKQLLNMQNNLQNLEWPLLNVLAISQKLSENNLLDNKTLQQLVSGTSELLHPVNSILSNTILNNTVNIQQKNLLSYKALFTTVNGLLSANKQCRLIWQEQFEGKLLVNSVHLEQLLYNICNFSLDIHHANKTLDLQFKDASSGVNIIISAVKGASEIKVNHSQLKSLFRQANTLGYQLSFTQEKFIDFKLYIPNAKYNNKHNTQANFIFSNKKVALPEKLNDLPSKLENGDIKDSTSTSVNSISNNPKANSIYSELASFNLSNLPSKDLYKGLEQACQFFLDYLNDDSQITIIQHGQPVVKLGSEAFDSHHEKVINASDFTFEIITHEKLSDENEQLVQILISQTLMIQKAIKSFIQEPTILAEVYELTRNKEQIKYLKAESGYTGIYLQSKKEPRYISMRLRTIKLYFDESFLIQIHRSYLINPKKVSHVQQIAKLKYNLIIGSEKLPISRTYISSLKDLYPHWFD